MLMNILYGKLYHPDEGQIRLNGKRRLRPPDAIYEGIGRCTSTSR